MSRLGSSNDECVPLAREAQSSTWSQRGSFKSSIPQNAAGVTSVFEMLCAWVGAGHGRRETVQVKSNVCLVNHCPDCLCNTIGEFEVLARTYLQSPGQRQDASRNVLNCIFWLLGFFNLCCICFGAERVWYPGPLMSCSSLCGDASSTDVYKPSKNEVFSCWRGMLKRYCQF